MKNALLLSLLGILIYSCSSTQIGKKKIKYFDENNVEIRKSKFNRIWRENRLYTYGDSVNQKKLVLKVKHGKIANRPFLEALLENNIMDYLVNLVQF